MVNCGNIIFKVVEGTSATKDGEFFLYHTIHPDENS